MRSGIGLKFLFLFVLAFIIVLFFNTSQTLWMQSSVLRYRMLSNYLDTSNVNSETKHILFWTPFFDASFWGMDSETLTADKLKSVRCPSTNCVFTTNKKLLKHPHEYDAIVFHAAEEWHEMDLPSTRSPHQLYVMATKESPGEIKGNLGWDNDFYNLTMSYRLDSDINWFYGITIDLETGTRVAPAVHVQWREPDDDFHDNELLQLARRKNKTAAWFVSHCNVFSKRDDLAEKLQEFIDVDIYGKCGSLSCPRLSNECDELLNSTYRFYFAFENTLCIDYLTEKLYNTINHNVIPVIYSGAKLSRFLPPKSYIDANDFATVKDLAVHLKFLEKNPQEYIKYFWWRKYYRIMRWDDMELCAFCMKVNEPSWNSKRQVYVDIKEWFYRNACKKARIKF